MSIIKKYCPIYINTLNIFRPLETWLYNIWHHKHDTSLKPLKINIQFKKRPFEWLMENFYTWYWWDHPHIWDFWRKWVIVIFSDVQYKYTYGLRELESVPFILVRIFGYNLLITFDAPKGEDKYKYWEKLKQKNHD